MSAIDFQADIEKCLSEIHHLPVAHYERLMSLVNEAQMRQQELVRSLRVAMDALDDWRLHEKYRLFDEECRLREADVYYADDAEIVDNGESEWPEAEESA